MARGLKFGIKEVDRLYYLCGENKEADQLCSYHAADLHLCFAHMQNTGFPMTWLKYEPDLCNTGVRLR